MNEAAKLISDSILGVAFKTITVRGKAYTLTPPTIKTIAKAIRHFSKVGIDGEYSRVSVLSEVPGNYKYIVNGLCMLLSKGNFIKYHYLRITLNPTNTELRDAVKTAIDMMGGEAFFECAASVKQVSVIAAKQKQ